MCSDRVVNFLKIDSEVDSVRRLAAEVLDEIGRPRNMGSATSVQRALIQIGWSMSLIESACGRRPKAD
jgi:hypothetical protein